MKNRQQIRALLYLLALVFAYIFYKIPKYASDALRRRKQNQRAARYSGIGGSAPVIVAKSERIGAVTLSGIIFAIIGILLTYQSNQISQQYSDITKRQSLPRFQILFERSDGKYVTDKFREDLLFNNFAISNTGGLARNAVVTCVAFLNLMIDDPDGTYLETKVIPVLDYCPQNLQIAEMNDDMVILTHRNNGLYLEEFSKLFSDRLDIYQINNKFAKVGDPYTGFWYDVYFRIIYQDYVGTTRTEYYEISVLGYDPTEQVMNFNAPSVYEVVTITDGSKLFEIYEDSFPGGLWFGLGNMWRVDDFLIELVDKLISQAYSQAIDSDTSASQAKDSESVGLAMGYYLLTASHLPRRS